jgi:hypothetical protein
MHCLRRQGDKSASVSETMGSDFRQSKGGNHGQGLDKNGDIVWCHHRVGHFGRRRRSGAGGGALPRG